MKTPKANAWKVLSADRRSVSVSNLSCGLHYPVGEEVKPTLKGSKIFVFRHREDAEDWRLGDEPCVPCVAVNLVKIKWINGSLNEGCIERFWVKRAGYEDRREAYTGTYLADSITCLE